MLPTFLKDPGENLDYGLTWKLDPAETIADSTWSVPIGLTKGNTSIIDNLTTVWLSGGTADTIYTVTNTIVTSNGRTYQRSVTIRVLQR